jgi:hypothetical protein
MIEERKPGVSLMDSVWTGRVVRAVAAARRAETKFTGHEDLAQALFVVAKIAAFQLGVGRVNFLDE